MPKPDTGWSNGYWWLSTAFWPLAGLLQNQPSCEPAESLTITVQLESCSNSCSSSSPSCRAAGGFELLLDDHLAVGDRAVACRRRSHAMISGE